MLLVQVEKCMKAYRGRVRRNTLLAMWNERDDNKRSDLFKDPNPGESKTEVCEPEPSDEEFRITKNGP